MRINKSSLILRQKSATYILNKSIFIPCQNSTFTNSNTNLMPYRSALSFNNIKMPHYLGGLTWP